MTWSDAIEIAVYGGLCSAYGFLMGRWATHRVLKKREENHEGRL